MHNTFFIYNFNALVLVYCINEGMNEHFQKNISY